MEIKKIFFDMDGVLADFDKGVLEMCGIVTLPQNADFPPGYDENLWEKVREAGHFYDKLDFIPGAKEMFDDIYEQFGAKCEILTGVPKPSRNIPEASEDKVKWVRRLLSKDIVVNTVARKDKKNYCTGKDCILVDDYDRNINEWEASGGTGVLFTTAEEVVKKIKELSENN